MNVIADRIVRKNPFLRDWSNYGIVDIFNPVATAQYQHSVTIPTKPGMLHDFRDLRFFQPDGSEIPFWIESKTDGSTAFVWFKPYSASNRQAYVFYGNRDAVSQSNGDKVFEFFDDFLGSSLSARWTTYGSPTVSVSNSIASFSIPVATYQYIICNSAFGLDYAFLFRTYTSSSTSQLLHGAVQNTDMSGNIFAYNKYTGTDSIYCNDGTASNQAITSDFTVYRSRLLGRVSGSLKAFQDASYLGENTSHVPTSSCRQFFGGVGANVHYIDWCAVRKYTSTEPVCQFNQSGLRNPGYK